ncbi:MAG: tetratricopeptide repeat protein [Gammaproteobacteria bacterium]
MARSSVQRFVLPLVIILVCGCSDKTVSAPQEALELPPLPTISVDKLDEETQLKFDEIQQMLASNPRDGRSNAQFARLLHAYSLYAPAAIVYERCVALRPNDLECLYLEALTKRQLGNNEAASELLAQLVRRKPHFPRAAVVLASTYSEQGKLELAEPLFEQAVNKSADNLEAAYGLSMVLLDQGELERAKSILLGIHKNGQNFGIVHAALATLSRQQGRLEDAAFYTAAAQRFADSKIPFTDAVLWAVQDEQVGEQRLVKDAAALFKQGRLREAAAVYVKAVVVNPQNSTSHTSLVGIYGQLGNTRGAQRHFEKARELNPTSVAPLMAMGTVQLKRGNFAGARDLFAEVLELKPKHAEARTLRAYCAELLGETVQPEEFRRALDDDSTQSLAHYLLGRMLVKDEGCKKALPHLRASLRIESAQTPAFVSDLVRCLVEEGETNDARKWLESGFSMARHYRNAGAENALIQVRDELSSKLGLAVEGVSSQ